MTKYPSSIRLLNQTKTNRQRIHHGNVTIRYQHTVLPAGAGGGQRLYTPGCGTLCRTIHGIQEGVFTPPPAMPDLDYAGLQSLVDDAVTQLQAISREEVDALEGKALVFKLGKTEMPFVAENFVLSFSLPNFYFHATTAYDILRMLGVKIGKMDYLGQMRMGG